MTEQKLVFRVTERQETVRLDAAQPRQCRATLRSDCPDKNILPDAEMTITFGTQGKAAGELAKLQPGDRIVLLMKDEGLSSW